MSRDPFRFRHAKPRRRILRTARARDIAFVLTCAMLIVIATGLFFGLGAQAQTSGRMPADLPVLRTASWTSLVRYCHEHGRTVCDVLSGELRREERLGQRPARMVTSADGDTVFIVGDYGGHVRVVDES